MTDIPVELSNSVEDDAIDDADDTEVVGLVKEFTPEVITVVSVDIGVTARVDNTDAEGDDFESEVVPVVSKFIFVELAVAVDSRPDVDDTMEDGVGEDATLVVSFVDPVDESVDDETDDIPVLEDDA